VKHEATLPVSEPLVSVIVTCFMNPVVAVRNPGRRSVHREPIRNGRLLVRGVVVA
jgi:hypothetical protein